VTGRRGLAALLLIPALAGCDPKAGGGAEDTRDEIRVQFMGIGVFRFGNTISAFAGNSACRWRLETEPKKGLAKGEKPKVKGRGDYSTAKITVVKPKPDVVNVYLVYNAACGVWGDQ
jgi:hypothetical protein